MPDDDKHNSTDEIKITPAMIEAGEDVAHGFAVELGPTYASVADLVIGVYRAMHGRC